MAAGERVSIKVTKVIVAASGFYPVLKPNEVSALDARDNANPHKRHLPLRPFTNVAFNTYEVIVVEAAKPTGDSPMNLQRYFAPATGVTPSSPARTAAYGTAVTGVNANELEESLNAALANRKSDSGEFWKLGALTVDGTTLKATVTLVGGKNKPPQLNTVEQLDVFISNQTGKRFLPKDIHLAEVAK